MLTRRDLIVLTVSPALVLGVFLAFVLVLLDRGKSGRHAAAAGEDTYAEVMSLIENEYVTPVARERLIYGAMKGMLESLDEYSRGMDPAEWTEFRDASEGRSAGIGIRSGRIDGELVVLDVTPESPAFAAGLVAGDVITSIDGVAIGEKDSLDAVRERFTGVEGTAIRLGLRRGRSDIREVKVVRGEFKVETVHRFRIDDLALIRIETFNAQTAADVADAIDWAMPQHPKGIILDLRGNGGGSVQAAVDVVGFFHETECVMTSVGRRTKDTYATEGRAKAPDMPLVCLVNGDTASASEVVAGALQDYRRAFIIGEHTYGKGVVQNVYSLESRPAGLKITTARYLTPAGRFLQRGSDDDALSLKRGGIIPDQTVRVAPERMDALYEEWDRRAFASEIADRLRHEGTTTAPVRPDGSVDDPQVLAAADFLHGRSANARLEKP